MSGSAPVRTCVARPSASRSNTTRWPWRSMRKIEPLERVGGEHELGAVGVGTTIPSRVAGSNILTVPCM